MLNTKFHRHTICLLLFITLFIAPACSSSQEHPDLHSFLLAVTICNVLQVQTMLEKNPELACLHQHIDTFFGTVPSYTALHVLAQSDDTHCRKQTGIVNPRIYIAHLLLESGADINARTSHNTTPLHQAVRNKRHALTNFLLASGADVEAAEGVFRNRPLNIASKNGDQKMVRLLVKHGATLERTSCDFLNRPVRQALDNGAYKTVELLLSLGADFDDDWTCISSAIRFRICGARESEWHINAGALAQELSKQDVQNVIRRLPCMQKPICICNNGLLAESGCAVLTVLNSQEAYDVTKTPAEVNLLIMSFVLKEEAFELLRLNTKPLSKKIKITLECFKETMKTAYDRFLWNYLYRL